MRDRDEAGRLIATGSRAAQSGDLDTLREVNSALNEMLPTPQSPLGVISTVRRGR
ncbi:hypothetical protein [Actinomadura sp. CNU-125]|uniref:hypothetical protein n=1 Tax=Actinomadura sp. CNU-125 TaxID=1904961 RepID=UPI0021CCB773|nr:hypothetical protein [Actinomadura sp. CNU-125]